MKKRGWVLLEKETGNLVIDALGYVRFAGRKKDLRKLFLIDAKKPVTEPDDDDIDYGDSPCYYCEGEGWYWDGQRKRVCPKCHGRGTEEADDE
jgi:hypothetical protein